MTDLTSQQGLSLLKSTIEASPELMELWSSGSTGALRDLLNKPSLDGNVDADQESVVRFLIDSKIAGRLNARADVLRILIQNMVAKLGAELSPELLALELRLADILNMSMSIQSLPSLKLSDPSVRTSIAGMLDGLKDEGLLAVSDKTNFLSLGRGLVSVIEVTFEGGTRVSEEVIVRAMKGV